MGRGPAGSVTTWRGPARPGQPQDKAVAAWVPGSYIHWVYNRRLHPGIVVATTASRVWGLYMTKEGHVRLGRFGPDHLRAVMVIGRSATWEKLEAEFSLWGMLTQRERNARWRSRAGVE